MIPIWVCLFWFVVGFVVGVGAIVYLFAVRIGEDQPARQRYLRKLAEHFPIDYEMALHHHDVMHPPRPRIIEFPAIEFGLCHHCQLPWPLSGEKLEGHAQIGDSGKVVSGVCPGSGTADFDRDAYTTGFDNDGET